MGGSATAKCGHTGMRGDAAWLTNSRRRLLGEFATAGSELEVRLRGRSCGGDGWRACGKAQTGQEGPDDLGVGDHGNHRAPAIRDARSAVAISAGRVDYQMELGAALICMGLRKDRPDAIAEGRLVVDRAMDLPVYLETDVIDKELGRILAEEPEKACGFSRDGFIDVEAVGKDL